MLKAVQEIKRKEPQYANAIDFICEKLLEADREKFGPILGEAQVKFVESTKKAEEDKVLKKKRALEMQ